MNYQGSDGENHEIHKGTYVGGGEYTTNVMFDNTGEAMIWSSNGDSIKLSRPEVLKLMEVLQRKYVLDALSDIRGGSS